MERGLEESLMQYFNMQKMNIHSIMFMSKGKTQKNTIVI